MNETIEHVARAIWGDLPKWETQPDEVKDQVRNKARAAIAAMRELRIDWEVYDFATQGNSMFFKEGWEAVIDAILTSEEAVMAALLKEDDAIFRSE